jgi:hypothetical protein
MHYLRNQFRASILINFVKIVNDNWPRKMIKIYFVQLISRGIEKIISQIRKFRGHPGVELRAWILHILRILFIGFQVNSLTPSHPFCPEAEFLNVVGSSLKVFLFAIHSHLYYGFYSPPPLSKSGLKHCIRKLQVWELSRLCPETSTKLNSASVEGV